MIPCAFRLDDENHHHSTAVYIVPSFDSQDSHQRQREQRYPLDIQRQISSSSSHHSTSASSMMTSHPHRYYEDDSSYVSRSMDRDSDYHSVGSMDVIESAISNEHTDDDDDAYIRHRLQLQTIPTTATMTPYGNVNNRNSRQLPVQMQMTWDEDDTDQTQQQQQQQQQPSIPHHSNVFREPFRDISNDTTKYTGNMFYTRSL
jgi:hypothetical protein